MFEHYPLRFMFAFGLSVAAAVSFAVAWYRASRHARELEDRIFHALGTRPAPEQPDMLDDLSHRIDDIANGQDFLNRVLSEKLSRLPQRRERETTPV